MSSREPKPLPAGVGAGRPVHPFAVTVEEPVAVRFATNIIFESIVEFLKNLLMGYKERDSSGRVWDQISRLPYDVGPSPFRCGGELPTLKNP